jgi:TonB family protein
MKLQRFVVLPSQFLLGSLLALCLVSAFAGAGSASDQKKEKVVIRQGATLEMRTFISIPEATEACSAEESQWWKQIRKADADLLTGYKARSEKSVLEARGRFFRLLYEGQQKSYRVPLKDRPPQPLVIGRPARPYVAKKNKINGEVVLSVEYRADGLIGDIEIVKGLGWGLDESAIEAARQTVFLPAVKDGAFVPHRSEIKFEFTQKNTF